MIASAAVLFLPYAARPQSPFFVAVLRLPSVMPLRLMNDIANVPNLAQNQTNQTNTINRHSGLKETVFALQLVQLE